MTVQAVARISGHEAELMQAGREFYTIAKLPETEDWPEEYRGRIVSGAGSTEKRAVRQLIERIYRIHSDIALRRQNYRCARCGHLMTEYRGMQANHRVHRGQGRNDRIENLEGICADCHRKEHRG